MKSLLAASMLMVFGTLVYSQSSIDYYYYQSEDTTFFLQLTGI